MPGFEQYWFNQAERLKRMAEDTVTDALRCAGWKYTCDTPGSRWLWEAEIDGRAYRVSQEYAAFIQERRDREAYFEQYPDELAD